MLTWRRGVLAASCAGWVAMILACAGQAPGEAEREVARAAPGAVRLLDAAELDRLFSLKNEKDVPLPEGTICAVEGAVRSRGIVHETVTRTQTAPAKPGRVTVPRTSESYEVGPISQCEVVVLVKGYAAAPVTCVFAPSHAERVIALGVGQQVRVRGKAARELFQSGDKVRLTGCLLE